LCFENRFDVSPLYMTLDAHARPLTFAVTAILLRMQHRK
jgi:hypothetical protein